MTNLGNNVMDIAFKKGAGKSVFDKITFQCLLFQIGLTDFYTENSAVCHDC